MFRDDIGVKIVNQTGRTLNFSEANSPQLKSAITTTFLTADTAYSANDIQSIKAKVRTVALEDDMKALTELTAVLGSDQFFQVGCGALNVMIPSEDVMAFYYRPMSAPTLLAASRGTDGYEVGLQTFLAQTYILNPVYLAYKSDIETGVYIVKDLLESNRTLDIDESQFRISMDKNEIIGFLSYGWPRAQACMSLIANLPDGHMVEFAFLRHKDIGFGTSDHAHLQVYAPLICALIDKHYQKARAQFRSIPSQRRQKHVFDEFYADVLTKREREVVKLILTGHSGQAIGLKLGTALATAKTHRYNIYSKLGISSQAELFSAFLEHLAEVSDS